MQSAVIENGFAVVAGEIVVFNYDSLTRFYLSQTTGLFQWRQHSGKCLYGQATGSKKGYVVCRTVN
jgi:hypothetical protein